MDFTRAGGARGDQYTTGWPPRYVSLKRLWLADIETAGRFGRADRSDGFPLVGGRVVAVILATADGGHLR
jgi:hypothetical protein